MQTRPIGISILSVLYIIGGIGGLGITILNIQALMGDTASQTFDKLGVSSIYVVISFLFLGILVLAGGIGMWCGKKWGWWLGALYLMYSVARNIDALIMIPIVAERFSIPEAGLAQYYIKHGGRIVINLLFVLYFFKSSVEAYFQVERLNARKRFFKLLGATVGIVLIISTFGAIL